FKVGFPGAWQEKHKRREKIEQTFIIFFIELFL
ncbi:MAG: hypothetical protein ACI85I_001539, partial [Arenicella sp.]